VRILFDARSVRTPAGAYVFRGLCTGWLADPRTSAVLAAVPPGFARELLPDGVEPVPAPDAGWMQHIRMELPRIADDVRADIIFVPNGLPPRDSRAVIYFQDLYHFRLLSSPGKSLGARAMNVARAVWRNRAAPGCRLAVPVSTDIHREVIRRLHIPIVMIPNGVEVGAARWVGGSERVVVMGGRGYRKGEELAIKAWAGVEASVRAGRRLEIIGVEPADRRSQLRTLAERFAISAAIAIEGTLPREEYLDRICAANLALSCSRLEAFGLPVAEALVIGAPVIASDLPSHRELMARAGAGETFASGSVEALTASLDRALRGMLPERLSAYPRGWSWRERARQHINAYLQPGTAAA
jgi:glycosyltransferase involved in cell wall biosynthesis